MKLGMPILYEYNSIEENLILAKKLNLDFVELNLNFSYCRKEMEEGKVNELLKKYNLEATLHFFDEADMGSYDEVVEAYLNLLEKYAKLGKDYVRYLNIHNERGPLVTISGNKNFIYEKEYDEYLKRIIKNFKRVNDILDKYNIKMVIENIDGTNGANFIYQNFINLQKEGYHFTLDIGHDNLENDMFYNLNKTHNFKFDEMHFHDADRKKCHLALTEGTMDLKQYKELAIKNDSYVVLEVKSSEDIIKSVPIFKEL